MSEYRIMIEETVTDSFTVVAESAEAAKKIAEEKYKNCEFILEPGNLILKRMAILPSKSGCAEWSEF